VAADDPSRRSELQRAGQVYGALLQKMGVPDADIVGRVQEAARTDGR
jgi:hypothetical protein